MDKCWVGSRGDLTHRVWACCGRVGQRKGGCQAAEQWAWGLAGGRAVTPTAAVNHILPGISSALTHVAPPHARAPPRQTAQGGVSHPVSLQREFLLSVLVPQEAGPLSRRPEGPGCRLLLLEPWQLWAVTQESSLIFHPGLWGWNNRSRAWLARVRLGQML